MKELSNGVLKIVSGGSNKKWSQGEENVANTFTTIRTVSTVMGCIEIGGTFLGPAGAVGGGVLCGIASALSFDKNKDLVKTHTQNAYEANQALPGGFGGEGF